MKRVEILVQQQEVRRRPLHSGSVVFSDASGRKLSSTAPNQFLINAQGNVGIDTDRPEEKLTVAGNVKAKAFIGDGSQLTRNSRRRFNGSGKYYG